MAFCQVDIVLVTTKMPWLRHIDVVIIGRAMLRPSGNRGLILFLPCSCWQEHICAAYLMSPRTVKSFCSDISGTPSTRIDVLARKAKIKRSADIAIPKVLLTVEQRARGLNGLFLLLFLMF